LTETGEKERGEVTPAKGPQRLLFKRSRNQLFAEVNPSRRGVSGNVRKRVPYCKGAPEIPRKMPRKLNKRGRPGGAEQYPSRTSSRGPESKRTGDTWKGFKGTLTRPGGGSRRTRKLPHKKEKPAGVRETSVEGRPSRREMGERERQNCRLGDKERKVQGAREGTEREKGEELEPLGKNTVGCPEDTPKRGQKINTNHLGGPPGLGGD